MSAEPVTISEPPEGALPVGVRIARNVKAISYAEGLSLKDVAEASGIPYKRLSERLSGTTKWSAEDVSDVATALSVEPGRLYDDPEVGFRTGSELAPAPDYIGQLELALGGPQPRLRVAG
jgi:transcriptional regulator with XRE-family HTH domain